MKVSEMIKAPFVPVPQVQVRIMTNVPKSPGTPQPSDSAPPQFLQQQGNTSSHTYQVRQAMTSSQTSDCSEGDMNWSYYPYPPLPPPPPPLHYLPPSRPSSTPPYPVMSSRPSSTPPYPSPMPPPPTPPPVTPPPTPEQYQQMWQHFNNFYAYYYQQPPAPAHYYYPPPPPYPPPSYSFSYPSDTEDGYSGYSSTDEMNGYFNKQRQYYQQMRGTHIESVENSETEYETSDTERPNEYQVKLCDTEDEEDTEYPMTTSIESAESVVGDYLSTIVEESEISDRKSPLSDCTLEKLSEDEDEEEINTDEEVVFVKLPLSVNRKDEVTTIIVGNSSKVAENKGDEDYIENELKRETAILSEQMNEFKNHADGDGSKNSFDRASPSNRRGTSPDTLIMNKIESSSRHDEDERNMLLRSSIEDENMNNEQQQSFKSSNTNDDEEDISIVETYEEKKVKEKRIKNTQTKISISYNGIKDEKIINAVKKRTNKSSKSVYTSRLSGESFDFDCWSENDSSQQEEVIDDCKTGDKRWNRTEEWNDLDRTVNTNNEMSATKHTIVTEDLTINENEPNIAVTIKFPIKTNLQKPNRGVRSVVHDQEITQPESDVEQVNNNYNEYLCSTNLSEFQNSVLESNKSKTVKRQMDQSTYSPKNSRCETPTEENSQSSERSRGSQELSESSEGSGGKVCSFLENLSSILQNIKMSKSMENEELSQILEGQESSNVTTIENVRTSVTVTSRDYNISENNSGELEHHQIVQKEQIETRRENVKIENNTFESESNGNCIEDNNESDEIDFWAEIGQPDEHMHLSMSHVGEPNLPELETETKQSNEETLLNERMSEMTDERQTNKTDICDRDSENDESNESESEKSDSIGDSSSSDSETTSESSSSSCEEDEEEGRTFVFYHDSGDKGTSYYNYLAPSNTDIDTSYYSDVTPSNPPEIRIQKNEESCDEFNMNKTQITNDTPVSCEQEIQITSQTISSSPGSQQYCSYEMEKSQEETEIMNNTLHVEERKSCQYESEEDDSGVTSDMSRHISETDTDHDQEFTELKKMSPYKRANTHSRLYQLLQDECEMDKLDTCEITVPKKENLSLPLGCNSIDNSNVSTPTSPVISDKLVKELVQSLLNKKKGKIFRNLPVEKLHAAAIRILQEDVDYDTFSSTSGESSLLESPAEHSPIATPLQRTANKGIGAYLNYNEYYETWASASIRDSLGSDIIPSRAFKILQEHVKPGMVPGFIEGLQAKCPKVSSATNLPSVLEVRDTLTPVPENNPS
uniref:Uncharacterized protein n=3 Tax=Cacopsylla melanoneura TaxID=428564 RepID=A0A8D8QHP1_9HEMI